MQLDQARPSVKAIRWMTIAFGAAILAGTAIHAWRIVRGLPG